PNAGKSTLLSAFTAADPEIAGHPFTTQAPNLGALFRGHEQLTICDIPGLIDDAHKGAGLGLDFLRHIERTKILLHLVDVSGTHPIDEYRSVRNELRAYKPELLDKPYVLVLNKIDQADWDVIDIFLEEIDYPGPVVLLSALEGTGLKTLKNIIWANWERLQEIEASQESEPEFDRVVSMDQQQPIKVQKLGDRYVLQGQRIEELVNRFNLSNPDAQSYVREKLLSAGLHKKLEAAGCEPGATIQVNDQVFNYTG
ncbi:MAG: Obg family GTPase CgtA, partial [bacterium]